MFIQTETTPNPDAVKFIPGPEVAPAGGSYDFRTAADAERSPLAQRLFKIAGVEGIYLGADFVSVTKGADDDWGTLKPRILAAIMDHYLTGLPAVDATAPVVIAEDESDVVRQIREILDDRVRPAVAMDGGDIVFDRFEDGIVYLHMRGACAGCPSSTATLKSGIENMLRHFVPEVQEVRPVL